MTIGGNMHDMSRYGKVPTMHLECGYVFRCVCGKAWNQCKRSCESDVKNEVI